MRTYEQRIVGPGITTALPTMDFETYSEAGYYWDPVKRKWKNLAPNKPGLKAVGAAVYSEHPSTEVLCLAYDLKTGEGPKLWRPGYPLPQDLFNHIARGELIEAWNSSFEYYIWANVCHARMGWPKLPYHQLRDAMAKAYAFSLPGKLEKAAQVLKSTEQKDSKGNALIKRLSVPRSPTKNNPKQRLTPVDVPEDFQAIYNYCVQDIKAEESTSLKMPDLQPAELNLWLLDQKINFKGVAIDTKALDDCINIIKQVQEKYTLELQLLTGGQVQTANEVKKIREWLEDHGLKMPDLTKEVVEKTLKRTDIPPHCKRVLEIRASLGASSVKKLFSIKLRLSKDGRLRSMFAFCGADRTGRWAGRGPQPHNLPNSGPVKEWNIDVVEEALQVISTQDVQAIEGRWKDVTKTVSGCLRGLFSATPGHDLLCSDYSAIEAVVLAELAGEPWRQEVFRTHGLIYEASASKITGIPFEEFTRHKAETGNHHPMRYKIGKFAELASGYQGALGAWKAFGADEFLTDDQIKEAVKKWREASPNIVNFWYNIEKTAIAAVESPGRCYEHRGITFGVKNNILYCKLLSGRLLTYHEPHLVPDVTPWGKQVFKLTYMGWNTDPKKGPTGWLRMATYGGKMVENIVQATARDILANGMLNLDQAGYEIVLHVHDEVVIEVPEGTGSIEEVERLMSAMPEWCSHWPVKAKGGWRGKRYRKD